MSDPLIKAVLAQSSPPGTLGDLTGEVAAYAKLHEAENDIDNAPRPPIDASPVLRLVSGLIAPTLKARETRINLHRDARRTMAKGMAAIRLAAQAAADGDDSHARALHATAAAHWRCAASLCAKDGRATFGKQLIKFCNRHEYPHAKTAQKVDPLTEMVDCGAWPALREISLNVHVNLANGPADVVVQKYPKGVRYIGYVDANKWPKGKGFALISSDTWGACESWRHGKLNGVGERRIGQERWVGTFRNRMLHGDVTCYRAEGEIFRATFTVNEAHGTFTMTYPNGDHAEGRVEGRANALRFFDVNFYSARGGWEYHGSTNSNCLPDGQGIFRFANGGRFEGTARQGQPDNGEYTFGADEPLSGFKYVGGWLDCKKHGVGVLIDLVTGARYACRYKKDVLTTPAPTAGATTLPQKTDAALDVLTKT